MNTAVIGSILAALLLGLSAAVIADEDDALREECRKVAEGHGVSGEQLDSWTQRCVDNTRKARKEMQEREHHQGNGHGNGNGGHRMPEGHGH